MLFFSKKKAQSRTVCCSGKHVIVHVFCSVFLTLGTLDWSVFFYDHVIPLLSSRWSYSLVKQNSSVSRVHPAPGAIIISFFGSCHRPVHIPHRGVGHFTDHLGKEAMVTHSPIINTSAANNSINKMFCVSMCGLIC